MNNKYEGCCVFEGAYDIVHVQLKKVLMILRKEKEDNERARTAPVVSKPEAKRPSDDVMKKLSKREKEIEELKQILAEKEAECDTINGNMQSVSQSLQQANHELQSVRDEHAVAVETAKKTLSDLRQTKSSLDELKRKYQKVTKELKEEKQALITENAQLTQRQDELQVAAGQTAQLKKQLAQARERVSSIAHEYEDRLREQETSHKNAIQEITATWQAKVSEVVASRDADVAAASRDATATAEEGQNGLISRLQEELHLEKEENVDLLQTVKSLQDKLKVAQEVVREGTSRIILLIPTLCFETSHAAELAKKEAQLNAEHAQDMCSRAEEAAEACESQARKCKDETIVLEEKLQLIDNALKLRGISIEFLLKKNATTGGNNNHDGDETSGTATLSSSIKKDTMKASLKKHKQTPEVTPSTETRSRRK
ncbi:hypothetical protein DYB32_008706 [Aphanomyces invadans]|uniref:Uncharacterized protein n=1 Tax=Aphanomyces invadans TaxID=157072 RepID=A0A418AKB5_9STRA|nr:hypothetical protein DYB32_008706 [Aphanomyces invadans]